MEDSAGLSASRAAFHCFGSNSPSRVWSWSGSRVRMSVKYSLGFTRSRRQFAISVIYTSAQSPVFLNVLKDNVTMFGLTPMAR